MKVLVTGFDPFGGDVTNPALEAVRALPSRIAGAGVLTLEVPTVFGRAIDVVTAAIDELQPDAVVCVGQAGGRFDVTPERVAINVDDARIPDNEGQQPVDRPVVEGGPAAYFSTLPVKAMVQAVRAAGLPASLSNSAGTFVCNHLMYGVLHHLATRSPATRGGFVHVPFTWSQVVDRPATPAMALADITRALEAAVAAVVTTTEDIATVEGTTH